MAGLKEEGEGGEIVATLAQSCRYSYRLAHNPTCHNELAIEEDKG